MDQNKQNVNEKEENGKIISNLKSYKQINLFISPSLIKLKTTDFTLNDPRIPIGLNDMSCTIILFYIDNTESKNLGAIFAEVAETAAGIKFAAINMNYETEIAQAFVKVKSGPASPVHWAGLKQYPYILVYRDGLPKAAYNGERSVGAITNWALTLACKFDYVEISQEFGGAQVENNIEMSGVRTYSETFKQGSTKNNSTQFKANEDIRGYDPSQGIRKIDFSELSEVNEDNLGSDSENIEEEIPSSQEIKPFSV